MTTTSSQADLSRPLQAGGQAKSARTRALVVDHLCVLPYGHNLNALVLFGTALSTEFDEVICFASEKLSDSAEQSSQVERVLYYPYGGFISPGGSESPKKQRSVPDLRKWAKRLIYTGVTTATGYDLVERRVFENWKRIFKAYKVSSADTIFFPSSDYYGCVSLLRLLRRLPAASRPKVHVRLIGVMEGTAYRIGPSRPRFLAAVREALSDGIDVTISAEAEGYVRHIQRVVGAPVAYLPYPLVNQPVALSWDAVKRVACPGQGRDDKGFFRIYPIIAALAKTGAHLQFTFDIQDMRPSDVTFRKRYQSALRRTPNVTLRPARLSQDEIDDVYRSADILLLPYDPVVYSMRGSAAYQEGLAFGRLTLCTEGTGIAEMVRRYGNGAVATSAEDFARQLLALSSLDRTTVETMLSEARRKYLADYSAGLRQALGN